VLAVAVGILCVVGLVHHLTGARFQGSAVAERMTESECVSLLTSTRYGFSTSAASGICGAGTQATWFRVTVRNSGLRGAYLKGCDVFGVDGSGHVLFHGLVSVGPLGFATGPFLAHGQSLTYSWYLTRSSPRLAPFEPKTAAMGYRVTCQPIDYHGGLPS
jgi:hypothetical protein